jgi:hypothetical protein
MSLELAKPSIAALAWDLHHAKPQPYRGDILMVVCDD